MTNTTPGPWTSPTKSDADAFAVRCDDVAAGRLTPFLADLIRGCPFTFNCMPTDARIFAEQVMPELNVADDMHGFLRSALHSLMRDPDPGRFRTAAQAFRVAAGYSTDETASYSQCASRCDFYAAIAGCPRSLNHVAADAVSIAYSKGLSAGAISGHVRGAVGWLLASGGKLAVPKQWTLETASAFIGQVDASGFGRQLVRRMLTSRNALLGTRYPANDNKAADTPDDPDPAAGAVRRSPNLAIGRSFRIASERGAVGVSSITSARTAEARRVADGFQAVIAEELPVAAVPDLTLVRQTLIDEFPYAGTVVETLLNLMAGSARVTLPPLLLLGKSGIGKTSFAIALAEAIGLPFQVLSCGQTNDATVAATAKRWVAGEPSAPLSIIRQYQHASAVVILDDIDAAATLTGTGSLPDALLGLLEPRTARCWRDPHAGMPTDLSGALWIATATAVADLPKPLLARFRIVRFPAPEAEHIAALAPRILRAIAATRGLDPRWALPLTGDELEAIAAHWRGGSLRHLYRFVEAVLADRESRCVQQ